MMKRETYSIYLVLTGFSHKFHQLFYNASCSKPILITVCNIVSKYSL